MSLRICVPTKGRGRAWIDIYRRSFNEHKRVAISTYRKAFATGEARIHETKASGKTVAFSIVETLTPEIVLLSYLAASPDRRSVGVGSKHMRALLDRLPAELPHATALFLEIEHRDEPGISLEERTLRRRRAHFYERLGFEIWPGEYFAPDLHDPAAPPLSMELLWRPFPGMTGAPKLLREAIYAIYTTAYELPEGHPLISAALAQVDDGAMPCISLPRPHCSSRSSCSDPSCTCCTACS